MPRRGWKSTTVVVQALEPRNLLSSAPVPSAAQVNVSNTADNSEAPALAINNGKLQTIWGDRFTAQVRFREMDLATGVWSATEVFGGENVDPQYQWPDVAAGAGGATHIVYPTDGSGTSDPVYARTRAAGSSSWNARVLLGTNNFPNPARVAADGTGRVFAVWRDADGTGIFWAGSASGGASFSGGTIASQAGNMFTPDIAMGPDSIAHVVWTIRNSGSNGNNIRYADLNTSGFGPLWTVGATGDLGGYTADPAIVIDPATNIQYMVFRQQSGNDWIIRTMTRSPGGSWGNISDVATTPGNAGYAPAIAVDGAGAVHVSWTQLNGSGRDVYYSVKAPGSSTWIPKINVSNNSGGWNSRMAIVTAPDPAANGSGANIAHIVYQRGPGGDEDEIYYAPYRSDFVAPTMDVVDVSPDPRATGVASVNVVFSEPITGFDLSDIALTRNGVNVAIGGASISTSDNKTFTINGLGPLTSPAGTYVLNAGITGVADAFANAPTGSASDTWVNNVTNTAPSIASLSDSPDPVNAGANVTLIANGVTDPESDAVTVTFFRESNGVAGLQIGSDTTIGAATSGPYSITFASPAPGSYAYYAQATDASFLTSNTVSTNSTSVTTAPTIGSLSDSPDPIAAGASLTLTANSVVDAENDAITVAFYRESNGLAGLQVGSDAQVGSDSTSPYSATFTAPATPGTYQYYARAADVWGTTSNVVSTSNEVLVYSAPIDSPPDLVASFDTGSSSGDNYTRNNNSTFGFRLRFLVGPTVGGATINLYADGVLLATTVGGAGLTQIDTDGTIPLADGAHAITCTQIESGKSESLPSPALNVTIDATRPTADVVDVTPDPRNTSVSSIAINFDGTVNGFDLSDLTLKLDNGANLLTGSNTPTPASPASSFTVPNLSSITGATGTYVLSVNANSSIVDLAGNQMNVSASDTWVYGIPLPAWLAPGSQATWDNSSKLLTVNGAATIIADPGADNPTINADGASAILTINPTSDLAVHVASLNLTNGATATLTSLGVARTASNHRVLVVQSNTLSVDTSSKLDLTDNDLIVDYTGSAPNIEGLIRAGYNAGNWQGNRITSSAAAAVANGGVMLGVIDNALRQSPYATFSGQTVDTTTVLVKFTHRADLNLDGIVNVNDSFIFNGGYNEAIPAYLAIGDVNFDGLFTINDSFIFNGAYNESLPLI